MWRRTARRTAVLLTIMVAVLGVFAGTASSRVPAPGKPYASCVVAVADVPSAGICVVPDAGAATPCRWSTTPACASAWRTSNTVRTRPSCSTSTSRGHDPVAGDRVLPQRRVGGGLPQPGHAGDPAGGAARLRGRVGRLPARSGRAVSGAAAGRENCGPLGQGARPAIPFAGRPGVRGGRVGRRSPCGDGRGDAGRVRAHEPAARARGPDLASGRGGVAGRTARPEHDQPGSRHVGTGRSWRLCSAAPTRRQHSP